MSKIKQIAVAGVEEGSLTQCEALIFAVDEHGRLWVTNNRNLGEWDRVDSPPMKEGVVGGNIEFGPPDDYE